MARMVYLPLVGIIVGGIAGIIFIGASALFDSKALAVICCTVAAMALTGAFLERTNMASIVGLFVRYQSLLLIPSRSVPLVLIAAHAFSRFAAGSLTLKQPKDAPEPDDPVSTGKLLVMASLGMLPLLLVGSLLFLLLVPILWIIRTLLGVWLSRGEGGYTVERLISTQQAVEISFYLLVIVAYKFAFDLAAL